MAEDSRIALLVVGSGGLLLGLALGRYGLGYWASYATGTGTAIGTGTGTASSSSSPLPEGARAGTCGVCSSRPAATPLPLEQMVGHYDEFKMVLVVRNDLKMGKGKIGAQCGHATLGLYKEVVHRAPRALERWDKCGHTKVAVRVESEEEMFIIQDKAKCEGLPTYIAVDEGRTQIAPDSRTVMGVLGPAKVLAGVTGHLKLI